MTIFGGGQFGTSSFNALYDDVWVLTNANGVGGTPTWLPLAPVGGPPAPRAGHVAVYDTQNNQMVIFGGGNNGIESVPNDVWVLSNANGLGGTPTWTQLSPGGVPPSRREHFAAGYDANTNRMMIFGGCCYWTNDSWVLTNANGLAGTPQWIQLSPGGTLPGIRNTPAFGYDPGGNFLLIFGIAGAGLTYNDTWELLGANDSSGTPQWVNLIPNGQAGSPPINSGFNTSAASSYDIKNQRLISLENIPDGTGGAVLQPWVLAYQGATSGTIQITTNLSLATFTITGPTTYMGSGISFMQGDAPAGLYPHPPVPLPGGPVAPSLAESAPEQSLAWFETQLLAVRPLVGSVWHPGTTPPAGITATRLANSNSTCSPTNSLLPGSCPICPTHRSTAGQHRPNASPALENPCHLRSTPPPDRVSAWSARLRVALAPASLRRSRGRRPPSDEATGACDEHCLEPGARPSAPHSCARRTTATPCSSSTTACVDRHAPRRLPSPQYMPRSAPAVGLAKRGVIPPNNSTSECYLVTTVILV